MRQKFFYKDSSPATAVAHGGHVQDKAIEVVSAIIVHPTERRVLLCRRANNTHLGGMWEFPGGKVEEGESDQAALSRELFEELGIEVKCAVLINKQYQVQNSGQKVLIKTYAVLHHLGEVTLDARSHSQHLWIVTPEKFLPRVRSVEPFIKPWYSLFNSLFAGYYPMKIHTA